MGCISAPKYLKTTKALDKNMVERRQAEIVYQHLKEKLKGLEGKFVAIEPASGDYFIGTDPLEAYEQAKKKHPSKQFFYKRVGTRAAFVVGAVAR